MYTLVSKSVFFVILISFCGLCVTKAIEYKGEGCKTINEDGTCPGRGLYAVAGNCSVFQNCTTGEIFPLLDSCPQGLIFNGTECISTNNTMICAQMDCVLNKTTDEHEMDGIEDQLEGEKDKIIDTIQMKYPTSPQLQPTIIEMTKNKIAFKGAKPEEEIQVHLNKMVMNNNSRAISNETNNHRPSNKENDEEITNISTDNTSEKHAKIDSETVPTASDLYSKAPTPTTKDNYDLPNSTSSLFNNILVIFYALAAIIFFQMH